MGDEKIYTEMNIDKLLDLINKSENIEVSGAIYYVGEHVEINISVKEPTDEIIGKIVELARAHRINALIRNKRKRIQR